MALTRLVLAQALVALQLRVRLRGTHAEHERRGRGAGEGEGEGSVWLRLGWVELGVGSVLGVAGQVSAPQSRLGGGCFACSALASA